MGAAMDPPAAPLAIEAGFAEPEPDSGDKIGGKADEPDIGVVIRGARLTGHRNRGRQVASDARGGPSLDDIPHHVAHDVRDAWIQRPIQRTNLARQHDFAIPVFYTVYEPRLYRGSEVRERRVSGDQVERLHHRSA